MKKVVILCGGIGGAKLVKGFYNNTDIDLTVIVNTGDDAFIHGVCLSPDIDSVIYALAEIEGEQGWGRKGDSFTANKIFSELIGGFEFKLGDMDLGLNLYRTEMIKKGKTLTEITHLISKHFGLKENIYPMSNDPVQTKILTNDERLLDFQDYFVLEKAVPKIKEVFYTGSAEATVNNEVIKIIKDSDLIVIAPSNPILSIQPILSIDKYSEAIKNHKKVILVSPFIGSKTIKGPAAHNFLDLGFVPDVCGLENYYKGIVDKIIINYGDRKKVNSVEILETNTIMSTKENSIDLANYILDQ